MPEKETIIISYLLKQCTVRIQLLHLILNRGPHICVNTI